jgi:hypothetical protein
VTHERHPERYEIAAGIEHFVANEFVIEAQAVRIHHRTVVEDDRVVE